MEFEHDKNKSAINKQKHGIGFDEAQKLWDGRVVELQARDAGESRCLVVGRIGEVYWSAIITRRGGAIRIISVRRARDEERRTYEKG